MRYSLFFILYLVILFNIALCEKVGILTADTQTANDIKLVLDKFETKYSNSFQVNITKYDTDKTTLLGDVETIKKQDIKIIFASIGVDIIMPEDFNSIALKNGVYIFNIINHPLSTCLSNIIYGFDTCYTRFLTVSHYKHRYEQNIILGYNNLNDKNCLENIVEFLNHYGNDMSYSLIKENPTTAELDKFFTKLEEIKEKTIIYNSIGNKYIITKFEELVASHPNFEMITFTISMELFKTYPTKFELNNMLANMLLVDISEMIFDLENSATVDPTSSATPPPTITPTTSYNDIQVILYTIIKILSSQIINNKLNFEQTRFNFYNQKYEYIKDFSMSLLSNHRLIGNIKIAYLDGDKDSVKIKEIIEVPFLLPSSQVNGFPSNKYCNLIKSDEYLSDETYYIGIISNTEGDLSYFDGFILDSLEISIDEFYSKSSILGKSLISIYFDGSKESSIIKSEIDMKVKDYNIICIISTLEYGKLNEIVSNKYDFPILHLGSVSGDNCNGNILYSLPLTYNLITRSYQNLIKNHNNIFILYSHEESSVKSYEIISKYIEDEKNLNYKGSYEMTDVSSTSGNNAVDVINSKCKGSCLIISVIEREYNYWFFYKYNETITMNSVDYPILSFSLDEIIINHYEKDIFENAIIINSYLNSYESESSKSLKESLKCFSDEPILTSTMSLSYSVIKLFVDTINLMGKVDFATFKKSIEHSISESAGGRISWNNEGYLESYLFIGIVKNGTVELESKSIYIDQSMSFSDIYRKCDWSNNVEIRQSYYIVVYLRICKKDDDIYDDFYTEYFYGMTAAINRLHGGINNHRIIARKPIIRSLSELSNYMDSYYNDSAILAFFGSETNEERELMNKYLIVGDKLLFVVNAGEGEECYKNIVGLNRIPNHYSELLLGYFSQETSECVIVHLESNSSRLISSNLKKSSEIVKSLDCEEIELKNTSYESMNNTINEIKCNYTKVTIYTIINDIIFDFLDIMNENNMNRDNYEIIILDIVENIINLKKDKNTFDDIYFVSSYSNLLDSGSNQVWTNYIEKKTGKSVEMCNEISYAMFNTLTILNSILPSITDQKSESILKELYRNKYDLALESTTIESNNLIGIEILLTHYKDKKYELILIPRNGLRLQNQYSLVFNEDEIEYKNDFTVSDELIKSNNQRIGLWLNEEDNDDRVYYILKQYEIYINSNGGFKGNSIQLTLRYCLDNIEELSEMINNTDYEIIISNCKRNVIESLKNDIKENNVTLFSIRKEESNICDDKMYKYISLYNIK